jgi:cyclic-di-AMP phosphodiesterase PgpH
MKENNKLIPEKIKKSLLIFLKRLRSGPELFSIALCVITVIVIVASGNNESTRDIGNYEAGKVASNDVFASRSISFLDEEATRLRQESEIKQVPAVFRFSEETNVNILYSWNQFCNYADKLDTANISEAIRLINTEYQGDFSNETLNIYLSSTDRYVFRDYGVSVLNVILDKGIFSYRREDIISYNNNVLELVRIREDETLREIDSYDEIITISNIRDAMGDIVKTIEAPSAFKSIAVNLLRPFLTPNVFFSYPESQKRIEETKVMTSPVIKTIDKGYKIIRKGFIITEEEMEMMNTYLYSIPKKDPRNTLGFILLVLLVYMLYMILRGRLILGREINNSEHYLLSAITGLYIIGSVLIKNFSLGNGGFPVSLLIPTALFIMILAVFMGTRTAMIMALALPLGSYLAGVLDNHSYIIALVSGITASTVLHNAQNRMSLLKAGFIIAAANCFAVIIILLIRQADLLDYPAVLFGAVLNGVISGMLTLGFFPPLEHALNAVTSFRLLELSDLNAPILRKLFTTAPGTYSHSLMVANLAEQACQDIEANAMLARVGAYYHDIGKMENPDYFIENQTDHNRHDDLNPRLSATIIRSHVKLGVEKAHSLGLPKDVIAIISEHHGNSLITWFYNKAQEQEEVVNKEDFSYPGNPPRSRESAVVMLADITEAAVRTLNKPTAGKIDKFVQQLFEAKVDHGQLSESELSFRDLEIIKNAFVRVLAGYYHNRIEYPKQKDEAG